MEILNYMLFNLNLTISLCLAAISQRKRSKSLNGRRFTCNFSSKSKIERRFCLVITCNSKIERQLQDILGLIRLRYDRKSTF